MNRRLFFQVSGLSVLANALAACGARSTEGGDANSDDVAHEGAVLYMVDAMTPDAALDSADDVVEIREGFPVQLHDVACSRHDHELMVMPGRYSLANTPVRYLGGSHNVELTLRDLRRLAASEQIPFSTNGLSAGHGHCGLAWRTDRGLPTPATVPACTAGGRSRCLT